MSSISPDIHHTMTIIPNPPPTPPSDNDDSEQLPSCHLHDDVFYDSSHSQPSSPTIPPPNPLPNSATTSTSVTIAPSFHPRDENQDHVKLRATHLKEGYRAGISDSKTKHVQMGFDGGYEFGGKVGLVVGWVRGVGEGLIAAVAATAGKGKGKGAGEDRQRDKERELRALVRNMERELVVERVLGNEYLDQEGIWKWEVARWKDEGVDDSRNRIDHKAEQKAENEGDRRDVDIDLVVQSHPLIQKWVTKMVDVAGELGLDIMGSRSLSQGRVEDESSIRA